MSGQVRRFKKAKLFAVFNLFWHNDNTSPYAAGMEILFHFFFKIWFDYFSSMRSVCINVCVLCVQSNKSNFKKNKTKYRTIIWDFRCFSYVAPNIFFTYMRTCKKKEAKANKTFVQSNHREFFINRLVD